MPVKIALYPIYWLADMVSGQPFDRHVLPFRILEDVTLEEVSGLFTEQTWAWLQNELGRHAREQLQQIQYAIVHRCEVEDTETALCQDSSPRHAESVLRQLAALLRLIRPMRQGAQFMSGQLRDDNTLDVRHLDDPAGLLEVPEVQKLFHLENRHIEELRILAPLFLHAFTGCFWKFRMAVEFHEAGHFQDQYWKARYLLWCSALESIFTSHNLEHRGSLVARERIKWFLGRDTLLYPTGDIPDCCPQSRLTVGEVIGDIYAVRNYIAHGDRIPDEYFQRTLRDGVNGPLNTLEVCSEALSFIVRNSLLKIIRENLLQHFTNADSAEQYFAEYGLTKSAIRKRVNASCSNPILEAR